jgi:hypothetical protein
LPPVSPKRLPPPDPTPKWKEEIQNLESDLASLRAAFPKPKKVQEKSDEKIEDAAVDVFSKLAVILSEIAEETDKNNNNEQQSSSSSVRLVACSRAAVTQYETIKQNILEQIATQFEQRSKNLKEQVETIAIAFQDAHELKSVRADLFQSQRKNQGLENEIDTERQTVVELMAKISKLNPKAAKELQDQQKKQNDVAASSSSSFSDSSSLPASPQRSSSLVDSECQVSYPMIFENSADVAATPLDRDALLQKLADAEFLQIRLQRWQILEMHHLPPPRTAS